MMAPGPGLAKGRGSSGCVPRAEGSATRVGAAVGQPALRHAPEARTR